MARKVFVNWTSRAICVAVFLASLLLIFAMGRTNVRHFVNVKSSIEDIYKDRLVVNGMVFDLASLIHKKEAALLTSDRDFFGRTNSSINLQGEEIITEFKETYLTQIEEKTLLRFEQGVLELVELEKDADFIKSIDGDSALRRKSLDIVQSLKIDLKTLSGIQLSEGKRKLQLSDKAVKTMEFNQSIENYSMLVIGILILIVLLVPMPKTQNQD